MLNEDAYRRTRDAHADRPCPFERALASHCAACSRARWIHIAEREVAACSAAVVHAHCRAFHTALHEQALFALRVAAGGPWPHGKEIRAQCGGLLGLAAALGQSEGPVVDAAATVLEALARYGAVADFPYPEIMRGVAHYVPRPRRR